MATQLLRSEVILTFPIHRFRALANLTEAEVNALSALPDEEVHHARRTTIVREGEESTGFRLQIAGWITSSIMMPDGKRLIPKLHLPGDMIGTPDMAQRRSITTLTALTDAVTAFVPSERIGRLFKSHPRLAALFTVAAQMERIYLIDQLALVGVGRAKQRVAHFIVDVYERLSAAGEAGGGRFLLSTSQEVIGEILGLTGVHVNRTLRQLEEEGLITRRRPAKVHRRHEIEILDFERLNQLALIPQRQPEFELDWLPAAT